MKLRFLVPALVLALSTIAARAQTIGLYLNPVASIITNSKADTGTFAFLGDGATSQRFAGVDFGGYYEFAHYPRFDLSFDLRDTLQYANTSSLESVVAGLRVSSKPLAFYGLKPYGQASIGVGTTRSPYSSEPTNKPQFVLYGGVDKTLNKHIDWRIIEMSYSSLTTTSSAIYDSNTTPIPNATIIGFSTGFVFRFR
jgi:hypothetical protein